jgi:hypothetical protein
MIELIIILGLIAYIGWLKFSHHRQVNDLLAHAVVLQAQVEAAKDYLA